MAPTPSSSSSPMASKRGKQYRRLMMEKKAAIIKLVKSSQSQADVSKKFGISKQTVSDFLRKKYKIFEVAEKPSGAEKMNASQGVHPKLEDALVVWLNSMIDKDQQFFRATAALTPAALTAPAVGCMHFFFD
ncbi:hypothetical protein HPB51_012614 [Rhipicephalus microplus]|uniref:HTH psq-type domain-containing protein n=1 Tax=Rhipicephalus microplus TaxID=6941 RepID=A0A9J6E169_RHIMP|nr:hypothetical protein HPB51_012614 [Rhipicephalus microplus]